MPLYCNQNIFEETISQVQINAFDMEQNIKRPSQFLHLTETFRAIYELLKGLWFMKNFQFSNLGKGQPVLVVPGLMSTDLSTGLLRKFLNKLGYQASGWQMGRNLGRLESLPILIDKVQEMSNLHQQKVILIGWSMGGIFAREIAKTHPQFVKQLITIGSPFANITAPNNAKWVYDLLNKGVEIDPVFEAQLPKPAAVKTLALYSKQDGIVPWQACMEIEDNTHKNQEVKSSHFGMGANKSVLKAVYDELRN